MTRAMRYAAPAALLLAFALCAPATARADDFDAVVKNVRAACGGKKVRIPFLGLAGFATRIVRPAGVKSFKLAVFEDLTRTGDVSRLGAAIGQSLGPGWRTLVRVRAGRGAEQTHVYVREAGDNLKLMIVTPAPPSTGTVPSMSMAVRAQAARLVRVRVKRWTLPISDMLSIDNQ